MTFETNPRFLSDLLAQAHAGRLQLPEFQRSYVWADDDVQMLLASILKGFPIGALLTLTTGGEVNFSPRILEGVNPTREANGEGLAANDPAELLLDGQQRITSLYGALMSPFAMTVRRAQSERRMLQRFYYLNIEKALEPGEDIEDAILGLPRDRIRNDEVLHIDLSNAENEFETGSFPLNLAFHNSRMMQWLWNYQNYWQTHGQPHQEQANDFMLRILQPLQTDQVPVIRLLNHTSREAVCLVFEKVNVGGKKLDAFELVTAIFAGQRNHLNLRVDWTQRLRRIRVGANEQGVVNPVFANLRGFDFLQAVSLAVTHAARQAAIEAGADEPPQVSCKRGTLLQLDLEDYRVRADAVEEGFRRAGQFLNEQKILWAKDLPYPAQTVALAAIFAIVCRPPLAVPAYNLLPLAAPAYNLLKQWFWRTALAEDYGSSSETKLARDAEQVSRWIAGGNEPARLGLLNFNPERLDSLTTRNSAAYRAFAALLLRKGCRDFITGMPADIHNFGQNPMDVHHIFPRAWCRNHDIGSDRYDSILNKTPLTAASNREIGGDSPEDYLGRIACNHQLSNEQMDEILRSHLIEPSFLRNNDFHGFIADRKQKLADLAASAMGLPLTHCNQPGEPEVEIDEALENGSQDHD